MDIKEIAEEGKDGVTTDRSDTKVAAVKKFSRRAMNARRPESTKNPNTLNAPTGLQKDLQSYNSGQSSINTKAKDDGPHVVDDWSSHLAGSLGSQGDGEKQVIDDLPSDEEPPVAKKGKQLV